MSDLPGPARQLPWEKLLEWESGPPTATRVATRVKRLRARHRIVIALSESGWTNNDIAKSLGYTPSRVSIILRSDHPGIKTIRAKFAGQVADNITDVQSRITLYANEMLDRLVDHGRQTDRPELSRLAARDILHMAGFSPVKKQFLLHAEVPQEELGGVLGQIHKANTAIEKAAEYVIAEEVAVG